MNKNKLFILSIVINALMAIVALIIGAETACGGFIFGIIFTFEIKNALVYSPRLFSSNSLKAWYNKRGQLGKYRTECIVLYIIIVLASLVNLVEHILLLTKQKL